MLFIPDCNCEKGVQSVISWLHRIVSAICHCPNQPLPTHSISCSYWHPFYLVSKLVLISHLPAYGEVVMKLPLAGIKRRNSWTHFCSAVNPGQGLGRERIQSSGWCHSHPWPGLPVCLVAHKHAVIKGHPWRFDDDIKRKKKKITFLACFFMQLFLSISCLTYCSCERLVRMYCWYTPSTQVAK